MLQDSHMQGIWLWHVLPFYSLRWEKHKKLEVEQLLKQVGQISTPWFVFPTETFDTNSVNKQAHDGKMLLQDTLICDVKSLKVL